MLRCVSVSRRAAKAVAVGGVRLSRCSSSSPSPSPSPSLALRGTDREEVQRLLRLRRYDEDEVRASFDCLREIESERESEREKISSERDREGQTVDVQSGLARLVAEKEKLRKGAGQLSLSGADLERHSKALGAALLGNKNLLNQKPETRVDLPTYQRIIEEFGERVDSRVWSIGLSYLCTGLSVGIIIPCMTMLVAEMHIPPSVYGVVVSAFGLSKLLGNIPAGHFVEKYGRKPVMLGGSILMGLGLSAISLVFLPGFGIEWLIACRFFSGFGVAAFIAGGNMFVSDISTPLNRARTLAPVMASFSGGTALGPALGGALVHLVGLANTYIAIGGMFGLIGLLNHYTVTETLTARTAILSRRSSLTDSASIFSINELKEAMSGSFREARVTWIELWQSKQLRDVVTLHGINWFALSGAQMTLLPLFLVNSSMTLSPTDIAGCFAFNSLVSFLMAQPIAVVADKFGKHRVMLMGMLMLSISALAIPTSQSITELLVMLTPMAMASPCLNSIPTALISDLSSQKQRAQAMSLLRTSADIGLLFGAATAGLVTTYASLSHAFMFDATLVLGSFAWFGNQYGSTKNMGHQD